MKIHKNSWTVIIKIDFLLDFGARKSSCINNHCLILALKYILYVYMVDLIGKNYFYVNGYPEWCKFLFKLFTAVTGVHLCIFLPTVWNVNFVVWITHDLTFTAFLTHPRLSTNLLEINLCHLNSVYFTGVKFTL